MFNFYTEAKFNAFILEKIRETLFTLKLHNAEFLSF